MADLIGQHLGQYEIIGLLGEGGMAAVYRARQTTMQRDVAIKVIESKLARNPDFVKRFELEAQTVASLSQAHILKVFDYGQEGDIIYLVMELLQRSLADLIGKGPLPLATTLLLLDQVASALDYAHKKGIVHRDLKPQNILLDETGSAFLTDFGLAKLLNTDSALTQSGMAMGTPAYMAPEQWTGQPVDARTDIYALGVLAYEMFSGRLPFNADTPFQLMHMHVYELPPTIQSVRSDLPMGVGQVVERALAKDPDTRYASAGEFVNALRMAVSGQFPVEMGLKAGKTIELLPIHAPPKASSSSNKLLPNTDVVINPPVGTPNRAPLIAGIGVIAVVLLIVLIGAVLALRGNGTPAAIALAPSATLTAIPPSAVPPTMIPPSETALAVIVPTTQVPPTLTPDARDTVIAQQQAALLSINTLQAAFTATAQQVALQATLQAATANAQSTAAALTQQAPTATTLPTLTPMPILTATTPAAAELTADMNMMMATLPATTTPAAAVLTANMNMMMATLPATAAGTITAAPAALSSVGLVTFNDKAKDAHADAVHIALNGVPLPGEGQVYEAWLSDRVHTPLLLGKISVRADGSGTLDYADPKGANLLITYSVIMITVQDGGDLKIPGNVAFSGDIPPATDVHVQHIVAKFPDTPGNIGLIIGALQQEGILTDHVSLLNDAIKQGNVALAKQHLEHVYNIITGTDGAKDVNGDGKLTISPPGDGYGILNYLSNGVEHALLAANQPDATDAIKAHAASIQIEAANATTTLTQIQTLILQAADKKTVADMKPLIAQIASLNDTVVKGVPDTAGNVTPTKGSAALGAMYTDGLAMAAMPILPGDAAVKAVVANAATTAATPTPTATPTINVPNAMIIVIQGVQFTTRNVTVKAGTFVVFQNQSNENHTATADDNSFDTGVIPAGASSKPIQFKKAGVYPFYCQFHGGVGGIGMSGVITVQ